MSDNPAALVTLELPNGRRKSVAVPTIVNEVKGLAEACQQLGYTLVLSATTTADGQLRRRRLSVGRRSRTVRPVRSTPLRTRRRPRPFDVKALQQAMRERGFNPSAYSKRAGVSSSLVYYHMRALKKVKPSPSSSASKASFLKK